MRAETERVMGAFGYHATASYRLPGGLRALWHPCYFVLTGLTRTLRQGRYDAVISYGASATGLSAWLISRLTGAKFILELPGHPFRAVQYSGGSPLKLRITKWLVVFLVRRADRLHLLYPGQLDDLPSGSRDRPSSVFADFVPTSQLAATAEAPARYVLFLGYPFALKGVDVLIKAWLRITDRFPEYTLRIVGHCPNREPFERLAGGHPSIVFKEALDHPEALALIAGCTIFVLPSRTEGMGRVLLESMAAAKPVIGSAVDGIPHYIRDGENGFLFESESAADLAGKMQTLLADPALRAQIGHRAAEIAHREYSEAEYARRFTEMVAHTLRPSAGSGGAMSAPPRAARGPGARRSQAPDAS